MSLKGLLTSNPMSQELMDRFVREDRVDAGNCKSMIKEGVLTIPPAVIICDVPTGVRRIWCANFISIDVTLAPVSRCACTNDGAAPCVFMKTLPCDTITGKFNPPRNNGYEEKCHPVLGSPTNVSMFGLRSVPKCPSYTNAG
jgi:hypothetical protein